MFKNPFTDLSRNGGPGTLVLRLFLLKKYLTELLILASFNNVIYNQISLLC